MSLGLVGKHPKRRPVEPRRFDFARWTVILLLVAASISLAHADTGADPRADINAGYSYSGITGLPPKTFQGVAPAAETSVRFGAACALPISLSLVPASLAGPDASPIFPLNHVCDSLRDAFAEGSENAVSSVSEPPLARLEWSAPSQTFLFTFERRLDSSASGWSPGNNENAVAHVEDRPVKLAEDTPTADDRTCSTGPPCNAHPSSAVSQDDAPPADRTAFATPSITAGSNALARVWSRLLWPLLLALVAAVGWLLCKRWNRYDIALIRAARAGLRRREFHLEYQPVVSLRQGRCVGVEALLRWDNVAYGSRGPDHYMPFIEKTQLIGPLTQHVMSTATREISAIPGAKSLYVSIKMSTVQVLNPGFIADLNDVIPASEPTVILELDTSVVTEMGPQLARVMANARALGVQFALSGIGPSFTELRWHPQPNFEMAKIDREIFTFAPYERSRYFESMISMAHRLHAVVVVEGVETAAHHAAVRTTQAELGQGFFYGRALSISRLAAFLATGGGATILAWRIRKYS
jgi:c-di-GMP phosphodiesterase